MSDIQQGGFTIDGPRSRDLDDAVLLREDGRDVVVDVTIADLTRLLPAGSPLDREAAQRGMTVYAGQSVIRPMLPLALSEGRASLLPGVDRPGLTYTIRLDADLAVKDFSFRRTVFRSSGRLAHADVDAILRDCGHELHGMLGLAWDLAQGLMNERRRQGGLAIYDLKSGWATTEEGHLVRLLSDRRNAGYVVVQELMILTNRLAADHARAAGLPVMFRNHTPRGLPTGDPAALRRAIAELARMEHPEFQGKTEDDLFNWLKKMLGRAEVGTACVGHFGLALPAYCYVTSPIRRYADAMNQRAQVASIDPSVPMPTLDETTAAAEHYNEVERALREFRDNRYQEATTRQASVALAQGGAALRTVPENVFRRALLVAGDRGMDESALAELRQETVRRIDADKLPERDYIRILLEAGEALGPSVVEHAVRALSAKPFKAKQIWNYLAQAEGWPEAPVLDTVFISPPPHPLFSSRASSAQHEGVGAPTCYGTDKATAESLAILALLLAVWGIEPPADLLTAWTTQPSAPDAAPTAPPAGAADATPPFDPKGALLEICVQRRWAATFTGAQSGPPHAPVFSARVVVTGDRTEHTAEASGATKKAAEKNAAAKLLEQAPFSRARQPAPAPIAPPAAVGASPISALQEFCQKNRLALPDYAFAAVAGGFRCTLTVALPSGRRTWTADAGSKAAAKTEAAGQAVAAIRAA